MSIFASGGSGERFHCVRRRICSALAWRPAGDGVAATTINVLLLKRHLANQTRPDQTRPSGRSFHCPFLSFMFFCAPSSGEERSGPRDNRNKNRPAKPTTSTRSGWQNEKMETCTAAILFSHYAMIMLQRVGLSWSFFFGDGVK